MGARCDETAHSGVLFKPCQTVQEGVTRQIRRVQEQRCRCVQSQPEGKEPPEGQRQDDKPQNGEPQHIERKPQGGASEHVQYQRQGGKLRDAGGAEGQPQCVHDAAGVGFQRGNAALQNPQRRDEERTCEPETPQPRQGKGHARDSREGELHSGIVQAQGIEDGHASQCQQKNIGKGHDPPEAAGGSAHEQPGNAPEQQHQAGPYQRWRGVTEPQVQPRQRWTEQCEECVGGHVQQEAGSGIPHEQDKQHGGKADHRKMLARKGEAVRKPRRVDPFGVGCGNPEAIPEQQGRDQP